MCRTASKNKSKHTGSVIYALSIFICYPNNMHRIPNESPELIFGGYILKDIWVRLQGAYIQGAYTQDFMVHLRCPRFK